MDFVKQMLISCDLNIEGLGSQADTPNQFDTRVRSNQVEDQGENNKNRNASITRSRSDDVVNQEYGKVEEQRRKHKPTTSRAVRRERENGKEKDYKKIKCC